MKVALRFFFVLLMMFSLNAEAKSPFKVLVLGDSLSEGLGVSPEDAWPHLVEKKLNETYKVTLINRSVSGSTTASGLSRLKWYLKSGEKPDLMVLELGANDGLRGVDLKETEKNLKAIIHHAKQEKIPVLLTGMQIPPNYGKDYALSFKNLFPKLAKSEQTDLVPFLLEGVAGHPELNQADGIHPTPKGHEVMAKVMLPYLEKYLVKVKGKAN